VNMAVQGPTVGRLTRYVEHESSRPIIIVDGQVTTYPTLTTHMGRVLFNATFFYLTL
jgi:hypothetical protein